MFLANDLPPCISFKVPNVSASVAVVPYPKEVKAF